MFTRTLRDFVIYLHRTLKMEKRDSLKIVVFWVEQISHLCY